MKAPKNTILGENIADGKKNKNKTPGAHLHNKTVAFKV